MKTVIITVAELISFGSLLGVFTLFATFPFSAYLFARTVVRLFGLSTSTPQEDRRDFKIGLGLIAIFVLSILGVFISTVLMNYCGVDDW
jgi:hypothetical protein